MLTLTPVGLGFRSKSKTFYLSSLFIGCRALRVRFGAPELIGMSHPPSHGSRSARQSLRIHVHFSWRVGYLKWPARDVLVNGFNSAWVKSRRDLMEGTRLGEAAAVHSRRDLTQPLSAYAGFVVVKAQGALSLEATDAVFCPTALFRRCVWVTARAGFFPGSSFCQSQPFVSCP